MQQIKAALFDFDGVLADTEPLYDQFWDDAGIRYHTGIPHFAAVIKGTTMSNVMKKYFSDRPEEEQRKIQAESDEFESRMPASSGFAGICQNAESTRSSGRTRHQFGKQKDEKGFSGNESGRTV